MKKPLYYKIVTGYGLEDYVEISPAELQKALYCFLEKKDSIFSGGPVKGSQILDIKPDYHRIMGWNRGYKLAGDDFNELSVKGIDRQAITLISRNKDVVMELMQTKRTDLIGQTPILEIEAPKVGATGGMKHIGEIKP